jgi:hypothetical protein
MNNAKTALTLAILGLFIQAQPTYAIFGIGDIFEGETEIESKTLDEVTINGNADLDKVTCKSLKVNGHLEFENLNVAGEASVNGSIEGKEGTFGSIHANGAMEVKKIKCGDLECTASVELKSSEITGSSKITGALKAKKTSFQALATSSAELDTCTVLGPLEVSEKLETEDCILSAVKVGKSAKSVKLKGTRVQSIHVKSGAKPKIMLAGTTNIDGDVTFESGEGEGEVIISGSLVKINGNVIGASVRTVDSED